jgi:putative ABC transport system permease protein
MWPSLTYLTIKRLLAAPGRGLLTITGVALGVAVFIAIRSANDSIFQSFQQSVADATGPVTLEVSGTTGRIDEQLLIPIRTFPNIVTATPILTLTATRHEPGTLPRAFPIIATDVLALAEYRAGLREHRDEAHFSLDALLSPNGILLGRDLARDLNLQAGDQFSVLIDSHAYLLIVTGILQTEGTLSDRWSHVAVIDIAPAQVLFNSLGRLDRIDLTTAPGQDLDAVADLLTQRLGPQILITRPAQRTAQVDHMVQAFQLNLTTLSSIGLLVGLLLIYNTMSYAVVQRRPEIAIFRAMGQSHVGVLWSILSEALLLGGLGGLLGTILGSSLADLLVALLGQTVSELYTHMNHLSPLQRVPLLHLFVEGIGLGLGVGLFGALIPGLHAARSNIVDTLAPGGYEISRTGNSRWSTVGGLTLLSFSAYAATRPPIHGLPIFGYLSALSLLVGLTCLIPWLLSALQQLSHRRQSLFSRLLFPSSPTVLAVDQMARTPGRSTVTVSAVIIGLSITIGVGLMIHSFRHTVELWIDQTIVADLIVVPPTWFHGNAGTRHEVSLPAILEARLAGIPDVEAIDPYRQTTATAHGQELVLVSRHLHLHAERSRYLFTEGDSTQILRDTVARDGVIVSEVLAERLGLRVNALLTIQTPSGFHAFPVIGIFYDYATDGGKVVMDEHLYRTLWQDTDVTIFALYLRPGADLNQIEHAIMAPQVESPETQVSSVTVVRNQALKREILEIFDRTFRVTYVLEGIAIVIAMLSIMNTLVVTVLERRREMASLRMMGATMRHLRMLVVHGSLYLTVLGIVLGSIGGVALALLFIHVLNKQSFGWTIQVALSPAIVVEAGLIALGGAFLAAYVPARWASTQPIAPALREL